jgi:hypothetical protein
MLGLEMWGFDVTCMYVSFLGNVALSAHQILLAITTYKIYHTYDENLFICFFSKKHFSASDLYIFLLFFL